MNRAYALLHVKALDEAQRTLTGMATTPEPDRIGDIIEPDGVRFKNPLPLLLFHDSRNPVGTVTLSKAKNGIAFEATISKVDEPGKLKENLDHAWHLVREKLVRAVSIGFRPINDAFDFMNDTGGIRWRETEVFELSLVTIPANAEATIHTVKSFDAPHLAVSGIKESRPVPRPGDTGSLKRRTTMKTIAERKQAFAAEKDAKVAKMNALMPDDGTTLDAAGQEEFDTFEAEVKALEGQLARLETLERLNIAKAVEPAGGDPLEASRSRAGESHVITVKENTMPGIGFARLAMVKTVARMDGRYVLDVAKEMFPQDARLLQHFQKAIVAAGTTVSPVYAAALVDPQNLASEFIEFLRPMTIIGKFGTNGIPGLRRVPFNVRITSQTTGGTAYWVGEGAPKPLTGFEFAAQTLLYTKVAAIAVITQELARFSTPSAEQLVRDGLRDAVVERLDTDFIDPAQSAVSAVSPASITNGLTAQSSAGTSADNARTDIGNLLEAFIAANVNPTSLVLIMPNTLALALSLMVNSLGQPEFPGLTMNGGSLLGIPVITSQYAANASGSGNLVIAVNASDIFLADDGQVTVDMSTEATLEMLSNPTNNSASGTATAHVSMFQTNSIALRAERFINWAKRRPSAVVYMDDVNWGSIGSPA